MYWDAEESLRPRSGDELNANYNCALATGEIHTTDSRRGAHPRSVRLHFAVEINDWDEFAIDQEPIGKDGAKFLRTTTAW